MGLRMFIDGKQGAAHTHFAASRKVIRVLFTDEDGVPEDTDTATTLELLVYSDVNRTTLVDTLTLSPDAGSKGHASYTFTAAYSTLPQGSNNYVWGRIERTVGDVSISEVASTLLVS